jgi:hypothetical protein
MKHWLIGLTSAALAACASAASLGTPATPAVKLKDYGPAPELTNEVWLNTDQPLRLADLRGQVVAIDMWTFG